ncbi:hypothetical protein GALMADRAFT_252397 [Galerina marginata CBS 339.88]|uniref:Carboxylic ester hydrolase n=1 Tax=Galerina marginata (strain CBS 339.88) TaxID=685588 RepID=A0A067SQ58_GALM3|nr:hypothetical protein GALMADRAFT_252397 [Galerina marginata CBS 339.88]
MLAPLPLLIASALPVVVYGLPSLPPTVFVDAAAIVGVNNGSVSKFLGIPFAKAPRFRLPVPVSPYFGILDASDYGPSCSQQVVQLASSSSSRRSAEDYGISPQFAKRDGSVAAEECLSINVIRPKTACSTDKLPVVVWIYGGGFETGSTLGYDDQSTRIVTRSIALGTPVIHVAMNYRLSAFGFLASKEIKGEGTGNFGLYDQRAALKWVNKYIQSFGGDPTKVTIWGQSAGAISVAMQMLAFGGKTDGLFRAGFMQSGSVVAVSDITNGQKNYDQLVNDTGCAGSNNTLQCLRNVSFDTLVAAINKSPSYLSYSSLSTAWTVRVDGTFLQDEPYKLVQAGKVAKIPIVSGNCDDEGTIFSQSQSNVTTEDDFRNYVSTIYVPDASDAQLEPFWTNYPSTPSEGSPYDTGDADELYPQYKRIASFQGDLTFQAPRRFFLQNLSGKQKIWSYLNKKLKTASPFGSYHTSDLVAGLLDDYIIRFTAFLDPTLASGPAWPQYNATTPKLYTFADGVGPFISDDTYRAEPMNYITNLATIFPF